MGTSNHSLLCFICCMLNNYLKYTSKKNYVKKLILEHEKLVKIKSLFHAAKDDILMNRELHVWDKTMFNSFKIKEYFNACFVLHLGNATNHNCLRKKNVFLIVFSKVSEKETLYCNYFLLMRNKRKGIVHQHMKETGIFLSCQFIIYHYTVASCYLSCLGRL